MADRPPTPPGYAMKLSKLLHLSASPDCPYCHYRMDRARTTYIARLARPLLGGKELWEYRRCRVLCWSGLVKRPGGVRRVVGKPLGLVARAADHVARYELVGLRFRRRRKPGVDGGLMR